MASTTLNYLAFQSFDFERTWWRLFWAYLMKVILSVLDEGYFERTSWRLFWAYFMKVILSVLDEGYFERTWWRLFWAYLMKVILSVLDEGYFERTWWRFFVETRRAHLIWYLLFYFIWRTLCQKRFIFLLCVTITTRPNSWITLYKYYIPSLIILNRGNRYMHIPCSLNVGHLNS
jgi:hypothetical protein